MATGAHIGDAWRSHRWAGTLAAGTLFLLAGILHALSFPPVDLAEGAYVCVLPVLLWGLFRDPVRGEGWLLFGSGLLSWIWLLSWLRHVTGHFSFPLAWLLGWLALVGLAVIVAIFWWAWGLAALRVMRTVRQRRAPERLAAMVGLAAFWVVLEWIRSWLAGGFPWLPLAASQWQRALVLQVVSLGGAGALSFVLVFFNVGLALYLQRLWMHRRSRWWQRISPEFYAAMALLAAAVGYGLGSAGLGHRERVEGPSLGFVQPATGVVEKWDEEYLRDNLNVLRDLTLYGRYLGAELILLPETPAPGSLWGNGWLRAWMEGLAREAGVPVLTGALAREGGDNGSLYNAVVLVEPEKGLWEEAFYAKRHLVPFGEYVPFGEDLPFVRGLVPQSGQFSEGTEPVPIPIERLSSGSMRDGDSGGEATTEIAYRRSRVAPLICYEDVFGRLALANARAGADWHYVATNNAWFGEEAGAYQHAAHSVLRAVETRRPVVRCGNAGWSGWIDEYGQIRHVVADENGSIYFQGVDVAEFSLSAYWRSRASLYVQYAGWMPWLWVSLSGLAFGAIRLRREGDRAGSGRSA